MPSREVVLDGTKEESPLCCGRLSVPEYQKWDLLGGEAFLIFFRFERELVSLGSHNLALRRKKKRVWSRVHVLAVAVVVSVPMADGTNMGMVSEAQMGTTWALLCSYYFWMHTVVYWRHDFASDWRKSSILLSAC